MTSEVAGWEMCPMGDFLRLVKGASYASEDLKGSGALLGLKAILPGGGFRSDGPKPFDGKHRPDQALDEGDLVMALTDITQDGSVLGSPAIVPPLDASPVVASLDIAKVEVTEGVDQRFVYFLLRDPRFRKWAAGHASGTTIRRIKAADVQQRAVRLPPLEEQRRISWILGSLDDKIETNRRIAKILEEIAATLFKAHFVDFVDRDDLTKSEIGPIPSGWSVRPVGDLAKYVNGKAFTKHGNDRGRMVLRIAELKSGPRASTVYTDYETEPEFMALPGDILFAWSGSLEVYRWHRKEALINQHIFKVIPNDVPNWFVYQALKHVMPHFQAIAADKATTMGHIKRSHLGQFNVAVPSAEEVARQDSLFSPLFELSLLSRSEAETLAVVRDALLPKLISGEIRICDAEATIEAHA